MANTLSKLARGVLLEKVLAENFGEGEAQELIELGLN